MKQIVIAVVVLGTLTGCSKNSGVLPKGPDVYSITETRAPVLGGVAEAKKAALAEAQAQCAKSGSVFFTVSDHESTNSPDSPWGNTTYDLTFRCAGSATGTVDDLPLNETSYRITAFGKTNQETEDLVLLHASEIALKRGYRGFVIERVVDESVSQVATAPGYLAAKSNTVVTGDANYAVGNTSTTATFSDPTSTVLYKPGAAVYVRLSQQSELQALPIYTKLAPKYGRPATPPAAQ